MRLFAILLAAVTFAIPALAGPKKINFDKLPPCVLECIIRHKGGGRHPLTRPNIPWQAWEWCQQTGLLRNDWWDEFGRKVDTCKIEMCPYLDEWYDAAEWHWNMCGSHYKTGDSLDFFNNWRKSTWWPNMPGTSRPAKGDGWIEGVWESRYRSGLAGVMEKRAASENAKDDSYGQQHAGSGLSAYLRRLW